MKTLKTLSLGLLAAVAVAGTASAQTIIRVAGSTAYRTPDTAAIILYLNANLPGGNTLHAAYDNSSSSLLGSSGAILANGTIGSGGNATIIVEAYWTGSLAGTVDVTAGNASGIYLDPSTLPAGDITTFNGSSVTVGTANNSVKFGGGSKLTTTVASASANTLAAAPNLAFSDSFAATIKSELATANLTAPIGSYSTLTALTNAISGSSATITNAGTSSLGAKHGTIGIVPFQWCIGNINSAGLTVLGTTVPTNMTQQTARALITNGYVPQAFLTGTGTAADLANYFYFTGRNEDSGTRIDYLEESQYGVTTDPTQFSVTSTTNNASGIDLEEFPAGSTLNTEPNLNWTDAGHSGYASGSNVKAALNIVENGGNAYNTDGNLAANNTGGSFLVSCLGITDASGVTGTQLSFNGVPFSAAAVENGQYSAWSYEHAFRLKSIGGTSLGNAIDAIVDDVYSTTADIASDGSHSLTGSAPSGVLAAGIPYSLMNFARPNSVEGQSIIP